MLAPRAVVGAAYGVLAATDTVLASRVSARPTARPAGRPHARWVTKSLLMPVLAGRSVSGPRGSGARRTLAAQALSWGGDVALLGEGRGPFVAGLCSFLGAHVAYTSACRNRSSTPLLSTRGRRGILAAGITVAAGMGLAAARSDRVLALPVMGYGVTLAAMVTSAASVDVDRGRAQVLTGATLFLLSDTLIGVRKFVLDGRSPGLEGAVMATYTAAQWCLGEGLARNVGAAS